MKSPKYEIDRDKNGLYFARYKAANGEIVMVGEGCKNKQDLIDTVNNMKQNAAAAPIIDLTIN